MPLAGTGEERVQRGRGAQPPKEILPRWCFLLTDSVWLGHCISLVGILGVMSAAALVTATLQALVSDAGGKLPLVGFEALLTPTASLYLTSILSMGHAHTGGSVRSSSGPSSCVSLLFDVVR